LVLALTIGTHEVFKLHFLIVIFLILLFWV